MKAALDARLSGVALDSAYQRAQDTLDECVALLRIGLSPTAAVISAALIVVREGIEAVVILAALLAGLRGSENSQIRKRIGAGAWLALAASAGLFIASRSLLRGLSRYGETLESVISSCSPSGDHSPHGEQLGVSQILLDGLERQAARSEQRPQRPRSSARRWRKRWRWSGSDS